MRLNCPFSCDYLVDGMGVVIFGFLAGGPAIVTFPPWVVMTLDLGVFLMVIVLTCSSAARR